MMSILQLIRFIYTDPVNLSAKAKLLAVLASFIAILVTAWITRTFVSDGSELILIASIGASTVLLFILPNSPLSQPWPLVGGQLLSAVIGVACTQFIPDTVWASAGAVGFSIFAMLLLRCLHPPGAATAIAPVVAGISSYHFVLVPVGINVLVMLGMAIVLNRWLLRNSYPSLPVDARAAKVEPSTGISNTDLQYALKNMDTFMDVSLEDLGKLLTAAEKNSFQRFKGNITCADIMVKNVLTVEYGTEVEEAWHIMHKNHLKALPVIDRSRRVIGIITWADFLKFINLHDEQNFRDTFLAFIRRTPDISTNKPESVGHIMSTHVAVLPETAHIVDLVPLMSDKDIRQIPIVNNENRLVGIVHQAQLCTALYDEQLAGIVKKQSQ
jgi:CBS domain-containing membrane protein